MKVSNIIAQKIQIVLYDIIYLSHPYDNSLLYTNVFALICTWLKLFLVRSCYTFYLGGSASFFIFYFFLSY